MEKIAIIGSGGSGKSTFARKLGDKLQLPVYHLDAILWKPNWTAVSRSQQEAIQLQLVNKEEWIIDGNYNGTLDLRLEAADCIIFMDMPRNLCIYRILKRNFLYRNTQRPDMATGCQERFDLKFLKWVWNYSRDQRPRVLQKLQRLAIEKELVILASPKEAKDFLEQLKTENPVAVK
ncbi:topology modulation protein [Planococcus massiliensis]|uniref:Topology modulation protein n=1 Tax=Planococcus massiliensis TaxID=1499687 RepID=A0A098EL08_9BACL|nr:DNA topology modulation protein [Planococcus massiliensis]CEG22983.1 topology modulation protein [Planococcus massiliensis]